MTTVHKTGKGEFVAYLKGAPETVLDKCTLVLENGKEKKITQADMDRILEFNNQLASNALRVLAIAYKKLPAYNEKLDDSEIEKGAVFVGLEGMIDPPREEAVEANRLCKKAES